MNDNIEYRPLHWWEIRQLEHQGCSASNWDNVYITEQTDLKLIWTVRFRGNVKVGPLTWVEGRDHGIYNSALTDTSTAMNVSIRNVALLKGAYVSDNAIIQDVGTIEFFPEAECGIGTEVSVLDETGSRSVCIYPGLSAQVAMLAARKPLWAQNHLKPLVEERLEDLGIIRPMIGHDSEIRNVNHMCNVSVGPEIEINGAERLVNGIVINNAGIKGRALSRIGAGVDAENFIIEDGIVDGGSLVRNCYIGQGSLIDKRFTVHDSLIFTNCSMENGEACAVFAGPYTTTMHKSTLLIGSVTSFMNAGSGTNESNHMYKLGPVHWGIMERGVKTSSGSYIMWGGKIGAFSLVMGSHKNHPDSSDFPFSYLFGDAKGATTVVPGRMLRNCGLLRDELKWPTRDRRQKRKLAIKDRVHFSVLNPYTVGRMLDSIELIKELLTHPADDDLFMRYKGMKVRASHLERAVHIYTQAIMKYLHNKLGDNPIPESTGEAEEWIDLGGQLMPRSVMNAAMKAESIDEIEEIFNEAFEKGDELEMQWIACRFGEEWRLKQSLIPAMAAEFDAAMEEDRQAYLDSLKAENEMLEL